MAKKKNTVPLTFLTLMREAKWWTGEDLRDAHKSKNGKRVSVDTASREVRHLAENKLIDYRYFPNETNNGRHKKWCLNHKNIRKLTC